MHVVRQVAVILKFDHGIDLTNDQRRGGL
jgi:hypothetical protein